MSSIKILSHAKYLFPPFENNSLTQTLSVNETAKLFGNNAKSKLSSFSLFKSNFILDKSFSKFSFELMFEKKLAHEKILTLY